MKQRSKKAVSPVLATLMMVAVAVALSVIIFTWSQGYLSQTGEAASAQQAAQNIAAQSGIMIETVITTRSTNSDNGTVTVYLRNIGSVSAELGSLQISGRSGNSGFKASIDKILTSDTQYFNYAPSKKLEIDAPSSLLLPKGSSTTIKVNFAKSDTSDDTDDDNYQLVAGDVISVKVTTKAATFAQGTYTVA